MAQFIKKENLTISVGEYQDAQGNSKKQWRTIGELVTMQGDDGQPYQFFKAWGAGGVVEGKVFPQNDNQQSQSQNAQQQSQGFNQQQGGFNQGQQQSGFNQQQQGGFAPQQQGGFNQSPQR